MQESGGRLVNCSVLSLDYSETDSGPSKIRTTTLKDTNNVSKSLLFGGSVHSFRALVALP